jgi:hypothetical protein
MLLVIGRGMQAKKILNGKLLGSFCYRKSANFSGVPVCKLQISILQNLKSHKRLGLQIANLQSFIFEEGSQHTI